MDNRNSYPKCIQTSRLEPIALLYLDELSPSGKPTERFIDQAKNHQATTKFTAEITDIETGTTLLDKTAFTEAKVYIRVRASHTHLASLLKNFRTQISSRVTHPESREVSSKGRRSDCLEQIPLKQHLRKKSITLIKRGNPESLV